MAKEAVIKIKEAEDAAAEIIRGAAEKARLVVQDNLKEALLEKESIIKSAEAAKEARVSGAKKEAQNSCAPVIEEGKKEVSKIQSPDKDKFEQAVKTVMERIVNFNGNS